MILYFIDKNTVGDLVTNKIIPRHVFNEIVSAHDHPPFFWATTYSPSDTLTVEEYEKINENGKFIIPREVFNKYMDMLDHNPIISSIYVPSDTMAIGEYRGNSKLSENEKAKEIKFYLDYYADDPEGLAFALECVLEESISTIDEENYRMQSTPTP